MTSKKCRYPLQLNRQEAADYIHRSKKTLANLARKGRKNRLKYVLEGREAYYDVADLEEYLKGEQTF